jgi:hypothetical protein
MITIHELGHILGGWCSGGILQEYDLVPWRIPFSLFAPNPHPLITLWSGPILGAGLPLLLAWFIRRNWAWFVAYFSLLANGSYLAIGWYSGDRYLDTIQLLNQGAHPFAIVLYCLVTISVGYLGFRHACAKCLGHNIMNDSTGDVG